MVLSPSLHLKKTMIDSHCHLPLNNDPQITSRFICAATEGDWEELSSQSNQNIPFFGIHPWYAENIDIPSFKERLRNILKAHPESGVGETGLDRLKNKIISNDARELFSAHLEIADEMNRPIVVHGAKCWGEVYKECAKYKNIPSFLFHGFSRSGGLIPDIASINGFFSVGHSILNDHAINYRELVKELPVDRILVESDCDGTKEIPSLKSIVEKLSEIRSMEFSEMNETIDENANRFIRRLK